MATKTQAGFTMPELLVVSAVFGILAVLALAFLRPQDYGSARRNAERWIGIAQLARALEQYEKDNGSLPAGITQELSLVGNDVEMLDLCDLTPKYLKQLPVEPLLHQDGVTCGTPDSILITGYAIQKTDAKHLEISAPFAESGETVVLKKEY